MQNGLTTAHGNDLDAPAAQALVALCAGLLPVWQRHLAASRQQSEAAVTEMLQAFADIGPHLNMAERQSQQINEALSRSIGGMPGLATACESLLGPVLKDEKLPAGAAQAIAQVLDMVRQTISALEDISKPFQHETQVVAEQVNRMYIGFQYQDRTSQMTTLLESDLARLHQAMVDQKDGVPELASWLAQLESQYAMAEQHSDHYNEASGGQPSGAGNETTFF